MNIEKGLKISLKRLKLVDETAFQTRASVDITIRFTPTYLDSVGYIANVKVNGDTGNKLPIDIETE